MLSELVQISDLERSAHVFEIVSVLRKMLSMCFLALCVAGAELTFGNFSAKLPHSLNNVKGLLGGPDVMSMTDNVILWFCLSWYASSLEKYSYKNIKTTKIIQESLDT